MSSRPAFRGPPGGGIGGFSGPTPRDVVVLLAVVFATFSLQFFAVTAPLISLLRLTPLVYRGAVWQVATYPFIGFGAPSLWILLELLILFWFARDTFLRLGRRRWWELVLVSAVGAGVVAVLAGLLSRLAFGDPGTTFLLMQGQRMLIAVTIAAFARLYGDATILLFFVLPVRARWFIWIEVLFAFIGYLGTKDLAGFLGLCTAIFLTVGMLTRGGPRQLLREGWLRLRRMWIEHKLARMRRKRRFDVIDGSEDDRYLH